MADFLRDPIWQFLGVLVAVVLSLAGWVWNTWFRKRQATDFVAAKPIADVLGVWLAKGEDDSDRISLNQQDGRVVSGTRTYRDAKGAEHAYTVTGYFDGMVLALSATSASPSETRTLVILMIRQNGTTFTGRRVYKRGANELATIDRTWRKQ